MFGRKEGRSGWKELMGSEVDTGPPEAIGLRGRRAGEVMASGTAEFLSEQVAGKFRERLQITGTRTQRLRSEGLREVEQGIGID